VGGVNGKGDCYNKGGVGRGKKVGREVDLKEKKEIYQEKTGSRR
jgi:hypothetical protein